MNDQTPPLPSLICGKNGLNYCCLWAFFTLFRKTGEIASRLGCSRQAVQKYRKRYREGRMKCESCEGCLYQASLPIVQSRSKRHLQE